MGVVVSIKNPHNTWYKKLYHYLFKCPSFWRLRPKFKCPKCGKRYRCYWDGNDIEGHGINICNKCALIIEKEK